MGKIENTEDLLVGLGGILGAAQVVSQINDASKEVLNRNATAEEMLVARKFGSKVQKNTYANKYLNRAQLFLATNSNELKAETKKVWDEKGLVLDNGVFYVRKAIVGGANTIKIFETSMDMEPGVTNIDKQKLPDYINLALARMELNYDSSTSLLITEVKKAEFAPLSSTNKDTALMNGEVEVIVGNQSLFTIPINQFQEGIENLPCPLNGVNFDQPKLITENTTIQININIPDGETMVTAGSMVHFVEFVFKGAITKLR